jgi:hypothetical protein
VPYRISALLAVKGRSPPTQLKMRRKYLTELVISASHRPANFERIEGRLD